MNDTPPANPQPDAGKARRWRVAIILVAISVVLLAAVLIAMTTAGFGPYDEAAGTARPPTLWEWLGLLIVPLAVAIGAAIITYVQKRTELDIADKARQEDRRNAEKARKKDHKIAQQARASEQQIAGDRLRQASLEVYYDRMTELLLTHKLREAAAEAEERSLARARTLAVARGLDEERKAQLLAFLQTSGLIGRNNPVIDLRGVDFSGADLHLADLSKANLGGANLSEANLGGANLSEADLGGANLGGANLGGAYLSGAILLMANLSGANLSGVVLSKADLRGVGLSGADLSMADLSGAGLSGTNLSRANLVRAYLSRAYLSGANLSEANLSEADLSRANLSEADLSEANLNEADLSRANLRGTRGWTSEQLEQADVAGSVMPDGTQLAAEATQGRDAIEGPTFAEWKARYLARPGAEGSLEGQA